MFEGNKINISSDLHLHDICILMFIAALVITVLGHGNNLSINRKIKKMKYMQSIEYYATFKKKIIQQYMTIWIS